MNTISEHRGEDIKIDRISKNVLLRGFRKLANKRVHEQALKTRKAASFLKRAQELDVWPNDIEGEIEKAIKRPVRQSLKDQKKQLKRKSNES